MRRTFFVIFGLLSSILLTPMQIAANPYFYLTGATEASEDVTHTLDLYLVTDGDTVTAMQTVVDFDNSFLQAKSISILGSECSFWAPADPSLGYGNTPSPYFYPSSNSSRVVFSCGFSNPGYTSADSNGDLISKIRFTPLNQGNTSLSIDGGDTLLRYIGSTITVDSMSDFDLTIFESTDSSTPTATPTATPTSSSASSSSDTSDGDSTTSDPQTLTEDDLNFVEIGINNNTTTGTGEDVTLEIIEEDDTLPGVPNLEPRAPATPFVFSLLSDGVGGGVEEDLGDVLAAQSLRELLIPGKSSADKTVVLINLISTITFLVLLAVIIWRLVTITRMNRLKSQHMKELLSSELAVLESKLGAAENPDTAAQIREEIDQAIKRLKDET